MQDTLDPFDSNAHSFMNEGSIGVLDSGVGGLSVLNELVNLLPTEHYIYVADSANAPYGPKTRQEIQGRCREILNFFLQQQVKTVVLACNTATAAAVAELREEFSFPIIGMEPALKPAAEITRTGIVGVLATEGTIESDKFVDLKSRFSDQVEIITVACHGLVDAIESQNYSRRKELLKEYIAPVLEKNADTLILGCTHYPLIMSEIKASLKELGAKNLKLIETSGAVAKEVQRIVKEASLSSVSNKKGQVKFFSNSLNNSQKLLFAEYWHKDIVLSLLPS